MTDHHALILMSTSLRLSQLDCGYGADVTAQEGGLGGAPDSERIAFALREQGVAVTLEAMIRLTRAND
jgi:hypothetical protein